MLSNHIGDGDVLASLSELLVGSYCDASKSFLLQCQPLHAAAHSKTTMLSDHIGDGDVLTSLSCLLVGPYCKHTVS